MRMCSTLLHLNIGEVNIVVYIWEQKKNWMVLNRGPYRDHTAKRAIFWKVLFSQRTTCETSFESSLSNYAFVWMNNYTLLNKKLFNARRKLEKWPRNSETGNEISILPSNFELSKLTRKFGDLIHANLVARVLRLFWSAGSHMSDSGVLEFYRNNPAATSSWFCYRKQLIKKNHIFFTTPESLLVTARWPRSLRTLSTRLDSWSSGHT